MQYTSGSTSTQLYYNGYATSGSTTMTAYLLTASQYSTLKSTCTQHNIPTSSYNTSAFYIDSTCASTLSSTSSMYTQKTTSTMTFSGTFYSTYTTAKTFTSSGTVRPIDQSQTQPAHPQHTAIRATTDTVLSKHSVPACQLFGRGSTGCSSPTQART
jgi:hypothetical protein